MMSSDSMLSLGEEGSGSAARRAGGSSYSSWFSSGMSSTSEGMTLSKGYPRATALRREVDGLLEAFESGRDRSIAAQQRLAALTNDFGRLTETLERRFDVEKRSMSHSESVMWKRRLEKLGDEINILRTSVSKQLGHIYRTQIEEDHRRKLFEGATERQVEHSYAREKDAILSSHAIIDSLRDQGKRIVDNVIGQNRTLKNAKRKMLDVGSSVGISSSLLGIISRRHAIDRWLVYGGMVLTILIFYFVYRMTRDHSPPVSDHFQDVSDSVVVGGSSA